MPTIPSGILFLWSGTNAAISGLTGWSRETGMDGNYAKGTANAVNPNATGGAATHTHTSAAHNHVSTHTHTNSGISTSSGGTGTVGATTTTTGARTTHTHTLPNWSDVHSTTDNQTPSTDANNNDPAYTTAIWIKSDGSPTGLPVGGIGFFNSAVGGGFTFCNGTSPTPDYRQRFLKGAATAADAGGTGDASSHVHTLAHTHTDTHTHAGAASGAATTARGGTGSNAAASATHTHNISGNSAGPSLADPGGTQTNAPSPVMEPPWVKLTPGYNNTGGAALPTGIIGAWLGTLASIPSDWNLCDGTKSTPDLRDKFVKCANTDGETGSGGAAGHGHTALAHHHAIAVHLHVTTVAETAATANVGTGTSTNATNHASVHGTPNSANSAAANSGDTTPTINAATDSQPPFRTVAFLQYNPPNITQSLSDPMPAYGEALYIKGPLVLSDSVVWADYAPMVDWLFYATDTVTYEKLNVEAGGPTPITPPSQSDAWGNLSDGSLSLKADHFISFTDDWSLLADATPIVDRPGITSTPKNYPLAADPWSNLGDAPPTVDRRGFLIVALTDPWGNLNDAPPTVIEIGKLTATPPADSWGNLNDQPPTVDRKDVPIRPAVMTDPWGNLADAPPTVSRPDVSSTPKNYPLAADPWGNLSDAPPTVDKRGNLLIALSADPWANLADAPPTVAEIGILKIAPPADPWETLNDQPPTVERKDVPIRPAVMVDPWGNLADAPPTVSRPDISSTPKNYPLAADPWGNLNDAPPTVDLRGALTPQPAADNFNNWADQPPTIAMTGAYQFALSADSLISNWVDAPTVLETGALTVALPADNLNNWTDYPPTYSKPDLTSTPKNYPLAADPMPAYDDSTMRLREGELIPVGDDLNNWLDAPTVLKKDVQIKLVLTDPRPDFVDTPAVGGMVYYRFTLTGDNLAAYVDTPTVSQGGRIDVALPADSMQNWGDTPLLITLGKTYQLTADPMVMGDLPADFPLGKVFTLPDEMVSYDDQPSFGVAGSIGLSDHMEIYGDDARVRGIVPVEKLTLGGRMGGAGGMSGGIGAKVSISGEWAKNSNE